MKIIIEGKEIEAKEGISVLDAALEAGIYIPHLCNHPDLEAAGGCRLCSVSVDGIEQAVPSCKTIVQEGMVVEINSEKADKTRKMAMELILASHPADCTGCPKYGKCELQSMYQYMGVGPEKWKKKSRTVPNDDSNPLISHLFTRCVRCGRCVRACRELRGVKVLDFQRTKDGIRIGTDGGISLEEAGCKFCGACIEVCPTGSIMDTLGMIKENVSYGDSIVPCKSACPVHTDIPRYIRYIKEGDFAKATAVIRERVPFPETLGNICNHVCEDHCKRNELENPISVCKLKRAAAGNDDGSWKKNIRRSEPTGKKVAIVGAGPAGLTSAYYLAKKGHEVTVFEENEKAGGQCRYGIPAYRLADEVLDREIADILAEGVELLTNAKVTSPKELLSKGYEAVLVSVGTHKGTLLPLEGNDLQGVYINADFLKKARQGVIVDIKERVVVLGGGNVAYDCARTALRLGAKEVHIACLENLEQMTATKDEIEEGKEEGVILHFAHSFLRIIGSEKVEGVELQKIEKFYFDSNRKAVIKLVEGSNEVVPADSVIFAVGQRPAGTEDMELELGHGLYIKTNEDLETSVEGIFATGDVVTGTKSVVTAIAGGRKSAEVIDRYLGGDGDISEQLVESETPSPYIGKYTGFAKLKRTMPKFKNSQIRKCNFDVVEEAFTKEAAKCEASRCLQCDLRLNLTQPKLWNEY
ncbi:FAD-dependent oxidoreductase [Clostridium estertheticum]|uniref:FAD-dependent oxidoreductase n=1 Tax=Clostridium estertheticum TaxID=238834 RepID=UPI001C7D696E|nr:FAD-dependent oxidoreductase [Clostridium estertheticum]MBX4267886.1 FAD-dependent oxidoreductase [Clostridium estertheticum]WLC78117.1 FAD-dependent oxidoreductase [Clostridium estertheticum]